MGFRVNTSEFSRSLRRLGQLNDKSQAENLQRYARTALSNRQGTGVLQITPPAGAGAAGSDARRRGEAAIASDLAAVFVPVKLKHKRRERWPDVGSIHAERFSRKHGGKHMTRGRAQAYYVDRQKLKQLRRELFGRIGALASGFVAAALRLGVAVPAWIARHGAARGSVAVVLSGPRKSIEIVNHAPDQAPTAETQRRLQYAVDRATARIDREVAHLVAQDAQRAGFKASA